MRLDEPLSKKFLLAMPTSMYEELEALAEQETARRNIRVPIAHLIREMVDAQLVMYGKKGSGKSAAVRRRS